MNTTPRKSVQCVRSLSAKSRYVGSTARTARRTCTEISWPATTSAMPFVGTFLISSDHYTFSLWTRRVDIRGCRLSIQQGTAPAPAPAPAPALALALEVALEVAVAVAPAGAPLIVAKEGHPLLDRKELQGASELPMWHWDQNRQQAGPQEVPKNLNHMCASKHTHK